MIHKESEVKKMCSRILAIAWLAFLVGIIATLKGSEPQPTYLVYTAWMKLQAFFVFALTMLLGYEAGKEAMKKKK